MNRRIFLAAVGAAAVALAAIPASPAQSSSHPNAAKITMVAEGKTLGFEGPKTVRSGSRLKVRNDTNPKKVGPHTLTLLTSKNMPTSKKQVKQCAQLKGLCGDIADAHELDRETFEIGRINVDPGEKGWDQPFGKVGDSWYVDRKSDVTARTVTAKPGTILRFFCVVHPLMQGKIKVVK